MICFKKKKYVRLIIDLIITGLSVVKSELFNKKQKGKTMKKILFIALVCLFSITTFAQTKYNVYKKQLINQKGKIVSDEASTGVNSN